MELYYNSKMELDPYHYFPATLGVILVLLLAHYLYKYCLLPYVKFTRKVNDLKGRYSIYQYPFRPFGLSYVMQFIKDLKQHGDSFYARKNDFSRVDMTIGTVREHLNINLVNQKLIQEFFERLKEGHYIKTNSGINFISLKQFLGDGILLSQTDEWKYKRKIMSSIFNYQLIKNKFGMMKEIVNETLKKAKSKGQIQGKYALEVNKIFQEMFGNVVIKCFFGNIDLGYVGGKQVFQFLYDLTNKIGSRNVRLSTFLFGSILIKYGIRKIDQEINHQIALFREYTKQTIFKIIDHVNENKIGNEEEGLIAKLIRENKLVKECPYEKKIKQSLYTHEDLVNEMCTFFFAGTDTTASVISSLVHKLVQHKDVERKLRQEISEVLKDDFANITLDNLKKMTYLRYVQSEILRIMAPVPFITMRQALHDHKIGDIHIEKGTFVTAEILSCQYKEEDFENPLAFIPERWEKLQNLPDLYRYYFPFSAGLRVCIGQQLALTESKIAIIAFLLNFKNGKERQPVRQLFNITYGPERCIMEYEEN